MAQFELILPKMGESVAEATITTWLKSEGDFIEAEESVVEVATDKVDSEVPSPVSGTLVKIISNVNDVAQVGAAIAIIETEGSGETEAATESAPAPAPAPPVEEVVAEIETQVAAAAQTAAPAAPNAPIAKNSNGRFYSPLVRSMAKEEGIGQAELDQIKGSGKDGRVTKKDVLAYLEGGRTAPAAAPAPAATPAAAPAAAPKAPAATATPSITPSAGDEIIEMDRMRKLIADHMVNSVQTSPHVTSFVEADMTKVVLWRNKVKKSFQEKHGEKITFTPIIMEAIVKAIQDVPMINVSIDGTNIIKHGNINVGMAAALPSGNLIVPVVKNADQLSLLGLTKAVNDLPIVQETMHLSHEISGGTYTLTNVGTEPARYPNYQSATSSHYGCGCDCEETCCGRNPRRRSHCRTTQNVLEPQLRPSRCRRCTWGMFVKRVAEYLEAWDMNREI